jgi:hypothetical protein
MFSLLGTWFMVFMGDFLQEHGPSNALESPRLGFVVLAYLVLAALLVTLYKRSNFEGGAALRGLKAGALVGLLWMLPLSLVLHGTMEYSLQIVMVDSAWAVVEEGIGGVVAALVCGDN